MMKLRLTFLVVLATMILLFGVFKIGYELERMNDFNEWYLLEEEEEEGITCA